MPPVKKSRQNSVDNKALRKLLGAILAVLFFGFGGMLIMHAVLKPKHQAKILQAALAEQFGSPPKAVVPNIPSRGGRYPGAVLAVTPSGSELLVRGMYRPANLPQVSGSLTGALLSEANAVWQLTGRTFGGTLQGHGSATVEVELKDIRIFEEESGSIAERLRSDESVGRARASGQNVVVVTKSYEAVPIITVRQQSQSKAEDWAKLKDELTKARGELTTDNAVIFRSTEPQVVAYEASDAKLIAGSFSAGDVKLELKRRISAPPANGAPTPDEFGAKSKGRGVAFAVLASAFYTADQFGDLPEAATSADVVDELLRTTGANSLETGANNSARLTTESFAEVRKKLVNTLKTMKPRAFVFYYAGHAVSGQSGAEYLVMGDYRGKLTNDLQQTTPFVSRGIAEGPLAGSNIKDIMKVVAAAGQELSTSKPGLVAVADIYRDFAEADVPFALVIDGCFEAEAMSKLREDLRFTPWGDYYGVDGDVTGRLQEFQQALRTYGEAPYLRSENPVIFAARPGTLARPVAHPVYHGDLVPRVAPLAAKLLGTYLFALENREDLSLGLWLRRIADFAGTGELDVKGSISWSDFEVFRKISMVNHDTSSSSTNP
jgi:hypothetical protein